MTPLRVGLRQACRPRSLAQRSAHLPRQSVWYASTGEESTFRGAGLIIGGVGVALIGTAAYLLYPAENTELARPKQAPITQEQPRPVAESKEGNRELISSQHTQVKKSWEKPGVYAWGSNSGRVAAPDSTEDVIKRPKRMTYFDGELLRDLKLDRNFGAAVTENGDLVQWGLGFDQNDPKPALTLVGKDLVKLALSRDRVLGLARNGTVYSLSVSSRDQRLGGQREESSRWGLWSCTSPVPYRTVKPPLSWGESVTDIASGLDHALLLTSKGRLFSCASSSTEYPTKGQLGVPGLTWDTRPDGPYDQPHEVSVLKDVKVKEIAAGDYHSIALDSEGRAFVFGDNTSGQLGFEVESGIPFVDGPIPLPFNKIYSGTQQQPKVTSVAAGGANSFFTVDATQVQGQPGQKQVAPARDLGRVTSDTWACGAGIVGSLGNGKWTHVSLGPSKIKQLSGLYEWDDKNETVVPIRLARLSVGSTHTAAVMDNLTHVDAGKKSSENETNWGADVVWWGGNEHYQLGTGKRNNVSTPTYIGPLDGAQGDAGKERKSEKHRFQITPRTTVRLGEDGKGRKVSVEQRVECGRHVSAVYSGT